MGKSALYWIFLYQVFIFLLHNFRVNVANTNSTAHHDHFLRAPGVMFGVRKQSCDTLPKFAKLSKYITILSISS